MNNARRIVLKVDCDTFEGSKAGIPNLLRLFEKKGVEASFFFTLGPDRSGRAIRRVFTQKGFLRKMIRSKAVSMYGPKTLMYGTFLPAPLIGKKLRDIIRSVYSSGHEVGVHGWDHVYWHDRLHAMSKEEVEKEYGTAHAVFEEIFGFRARSSAAPGWQVSPFSLEVQEDYKLLYTSNTRLGPPHFPVYRNVRYSTLEIPTTLPTWDEVLADPHFSDEEKLLNYFKEEIKGTEVHSIHTEVEGMNYRDLFERQLSLWQSENISFLTLEKYANEIHSNLNNMPCRELVRVELNNRGGFVSSSSQITDPALTLV